MLNVLSVYSIKKYKELQATDGYIPLYKYTQTRKVILRIDQLLYGLGNQVNEPETWKMNTNFYIYLNGMFCSITLNDQNFSYH